jgi:isocitrate lyase
VGAGYFDEVLKAATAGQSTTAALKGSTEEDQFEEPSYSDDIVPL